MPSDPSDLIDFIYMVLLIFSVVAILAIVTFINSIDNSSSKYIKGFFYLLILLNFLYGIKAIITKKAVFFYRNLKRPYNITTYSGKNAVAVGMWVIMLSLLLFIIFGLEPFLPTINEWTSKLPINQ